MRILSVGPDPDVLASRNRVLAKLGYEVRGAATCAEALHAARSQAFDIALVCSQFPRGYASELAAELRSLMPRSLVLFVPDGSEAELVEQIEDAIREADTGAKAA